MKQLEPHFFGWSSGESQLPNPLIDVYKCWESRLSKLAGVETIPNVIHHSIELVSQLLTLLLYINWVQRSVEFIWVVTLKLQDSKIFIIANVAVDVLIKFASLLLWREALVV